MNTYIVHYLTSKYNVKCVVHANTNREAADKVRAQVADVGRVTTVAGPVHEYN